MIQVSPVHNGLCDDPQAALDDLFIGSFDSNVLLFDVGRALRPPGVGADSSGGREARPRGLCKICPGGAQGPPLRKDKAMVNRILPIVLALLLVLSACAVPAA